MRPSARWAGGGRQRGALEQALYDRDIDNGEELIQHSDRGVQPSTSRSVARSGSPKPGSSSVSSVGDSYDNAPAETIIGLYKTEVIRQRGPWRNIEAVEFATLEWVNWFDHRRLFEPIGDLPPAKKEDEYYRNHESATVASTHNLEPPGFPGRFRDHSAIHSMR